MSATPDAEEDMAKLMCPNCGNSIDDERTWAQAALSTLVAAPAIPDMATQVRCAKCGRVSAASDMRTDSAYSLSKQHLVVWILGVALVAWAVAELLQR